ncbi:acyltransferase family protein [Sphingomonas sp. MMS12-HWE2-04]|uniref:acyltransferase family protein n=1 Tax=Sphingomonas sp. MMS12-HWE2-04 TaxID=3234199 RepID=UPI003850553B
MKRLSSMSVETETLLRALAISAIVFNHANPAQAETGFGLGGGLTFLILLSGFNLARYSLQGASSQAFRQSVLLLAWRVAWPTVLIVLLDWVVTGQRPALGYLLFYSNWFTWHHPALLQIWYPQMLIKLLLIFWVLFHFEPLAQLVRRKPFRAFLFAFVVAVVVRAIAPEWLEPPETRGRLVHFYAWNFLLGMLAYYALQSGPGRGPMLKRAIVMACAVIGAFVAYGPFKSDFWWLSIATAVWVSFPRFVLPRPIGQAVRVVSQAAFAVFLLHLFFLYVWWKANLPYAPLLQFVFSLGGSVAVWVVMTAFSRAYRAERGAGPATRPAPRLQEAAA